MQDPRMPLPEEVSNLKPRKKKSSTQKAAQFQLQGKNVKEAPEFPLSLPLKTGQKVPKRSAKNEIAPVLQQPERSTSDSLPDNTSGNEYRALRRKYLLLEEESFALGRELREAEDEVKILENEKLALLDQLVVLEGLIDPSEFQPVGMQSP